MNRVHRYLAVLIVLASASIACGFGISSAKPTDTPTPVPTETVEPQKNSIDDVLDAAATPGEIKLVIDEDQLTSIVAGEIRKQDDVPISNPQVRLRNGQIQFNATVEQQGISLPAEVVMNVQPDMNGHPDFKVVSATIGPFPLPADVKSQLETALDVAFTEEIESRAPNTRIESIVIADGVMTVIGRTG
ncbi:MAG: hypothetical protein P8X95_01150 [Anaerolineales bacterium]|jgi:hypothetical protein